MRKGAPRFLRSMPKVTQLAEVASTPSQMGVSGFTDLKAIILLFISLLKTV